jgi:hypothetical protein
MLSVFPFPPDRMVPAFVVSTNARAWHYNGEGKGGMGMSQWHEQTRGEFRRRAERWGYERAGGRRLGLGAEWLSRGRWRRPRRLRR